MAARTKAVAEATKVSSTNMELWTPRFTMSVEQAAGLVEQKREFFKKIMVKDLHYGVIPGTPKPSLWKPGAELLLSAMGLHAHIEDAAPPVQDYTGADHNNETFIEYRRACIIYRQTGPGRDDRMEIARDEGTCNSWEIKYRFRDSKRKCPDCGMETIMESRDRNDKGEPIEWFCWRKKGGCGHVFPYGDSRITSQVIGKVKNPDVLELSNTILKIASKRALVGACLIATAASDIFTQDLDEDREGAVERGEPVENGNGQTKAGENVESELVRLNNLLPEKNRWSPALLKGKLTQPAEKVALEMKALHLKFHSDCTCYGEPTAKADEAPAAAK